MAQSPVSERRGSILADIASGNFALRPATQRLSAPNGTQARRSVNIDDVAANGADTRSLVEQLSAAMAMRRGASRWTDSSDSERLSDDEW